MADSDSSEGGQSQDISSKKTRNSNFTPNEVALLAQLCEPHVQMLSGKHSNTVTQQKKDQMWAKIAKTINAQGFAKKIRTVKACKNKWQKMTSNAKSTVSNYKRQSMKTGGGPAPKPLDAVTERIANIYGGCPTWTGIHGGMETAAGPSTTATIAMNPSRSPPSNSATELLASLARGGDPPEPAAMIKTQFEDEYEEDELQQIIAEACRTTFTDNSVSDEEVEDALAERRNMAIAIESRHSSGKGKSKGRGKDKGKGKTTKAVTTDRVPELELDVVKTCRCICPLQHALLKQELACAALNEKKMRLEILKLEKDLNQ